MPVIFSSRFLKGDKNYSGLSLEFCWLVGFSDIWKLGVKTFIFFSARELFA